jgi:hypothetical protein
VIGQLTGLIERNFVIGYFLPVATFMAASLGLAVAFGLDPGGLDLTGGSLDETEVLVASALLALASALGGVLLMALNREVIRLMEGYPYRRLNGWQRRRYRRLCELDRYDKDGAGKPEEAEEGTLAGAPGRTRESCG